MTNSLVRQPFLERCRDATPRVARCATLLLSLLVFTFPAAQPALAQTESPSERAAAACDTVDPISLRSQLRTVSASVFAETQRRLDAAQTVGRYWAELDMDSVLDSSVDLALERAASDESWWGRVRNRFSAERAEELAGKVAAGAFGSQGFRFFIEQLSQTVGVELAVSIQHMVHSSASSTLQCVEEFIGASYSRSMADLLRARTQSRLASASGDTAPEIGYAQILQGNWGPASGLGLASGAQLSRVIAKGVAAGIAERAASRLLDGPDDGVAPAAVWAVDTILIVWDPLNAKEGTLPQIGRELKSAKVKETMRARLSAGLGQGLEADLARLARIVADDVFKLWQAYLVEHAQIFDLAQTVPEFRSILEGTDLDSVGRLNAMVKAASAALGDERLARTVRSGEFRQILALPAGAEEILRTQRDARQVVDWGTFAGEALAQVVETGLYRYASPADVGDRVSLARLLALREPAVVERMMRLEAEVREELLWLETDQARWIVAALTPEDAAWVAVYLHDLADGEAEALVELLKRRQGLLSTLKASAPLQADLPALLQLAAESAAFRQTVGGLSPQELGSLARTVRSSLQKMRPAELKEFLASGRFEHLLAVPDVTNAVLRLGEQGGAQLAGSWLELAGQENIAQVVQTGLHLHAAPAEFASRAELDAVLSIQDPDAVSALFQLPAEARAVLLGLEEETARALLLLDLPPQSLEWVSSFARSLSENDLLLLARSLLEQPRLKSELNRGAVRAALLSGRDFGAGLRYVIRRMQETRGAARTSAALAAVGPALTGEIPLALYLRYDAGAALNLLYALAALFALYLAWRRVFAGRRRPARPAALLTDSRREAGASPDVRKLESRDRAEEDRP